MGNQQDALDASDAKSKCLDYNALKELVNICLSIRRNLERLNVHGNELAVQSSKMKKLESAVENMEKGNILLEKERSVCTNLYFSHYIHEHVFRHSA